MRKKTEHNDSNMMGEDSTQMTLVDEVISRVPTVLLRIVFGYALRFSIASSMISRWYKAGFDGLEILIRRLLKLATVDAFYGKLLIELAYKDQRFQQDQDSYYMIGHLSIMSNPEFARHSFLQLIFNLVNRVKFPKTFVWCSDVVLRRNLPNLFSHGFDISINIASTQEQLNVIELNADVIKEWLDSKAENADISNEMIQQVRVMMTPGIIEGFRMVFNLSRERNYFRMSDNLPLKSSFFAESSRNYQLCRRELQLYELWCSPRIPFSENHWRMLEKMPPNEQRALIRQLMYWCPDQIFNLFSQARASTSRSSGDDKQPLSTYLGVLKQLSYGKEELMKELVLEIKRMEQLRKRPWELDVEYPGDDAPFEENLEFTVTYMSVCNDEASPYKVVVEFLSTMKNPILILKKLHNTQAQSQEPSRLLMKCVIM